MALVLADRVRETCNSPGTGVVSLLGAPAGYQRFSVVGNGNTTYYTIADQAGTNWEVGIGTWATGNTLTRTTVLTSSNSNSTVNFSSGVQDVFLTYPATRSAYVDGTTVTFANSANLPISAFNSGTGASSSTYWRGDGTWAALSSAFQGLGGQVFTSSGTFTVPAGVTAVKVTLAGAGGAGGAGYRPSGSYGFGAGGGGAGVGIAYVTGLTPGGTVSVTVGAGGTGSGTTAGSAGGTTSFGSYISCTGGGGGNRVNGNSGTSFSASGGAAGVVTGAAFSYAGSGGGSAGNSSTACGDILYYGSGGSFPPVLGLYGIGGSSTSGNNGPGGAASYYASGGGGGFVSGAVGGYAGGAGAPGIVFVEW